MAESVAKIEQRTHAPFPLVGGHGCRLGFAAFHNGMDARLDIAFLEAIEICFKPVEEITVADEPVFDHLGIACEEFTHRQRCQRIRVGEHEARLMESAGEVLALFRVDARLAANGAVYL